MQTALALALPCMLVLSPAPRASAEADWPQWGGPSRDGISPDKGLLRKWPDSGPGLVWSARGIGRGYSSPSIAGGTVYVTGLVGGDLVITALDMEGKEKWKKVHGPGWTGDYPGARSTPTISGGKLYLMSGKGLLACYDAAAGDRKWAAEMSQFGGSRGGWGYAESVLVFRNLAVVTPGGGNCIVALDKDSGKTVWKSTGLNEQAGYGSCIGFTHEKVPMVANLTSRGMVGVSALTGAFLWRNNRVANTTAVCTSPVYCDGYVFGASGYGNGGACVKLSVTGNGVTAAQVWETKDMDCHHGGYVVVDGYIYGNNGGGWSCLELKTGRKVWSGGGVGKGSICYADGMLYTYSENGGRIGLAEATPKALSLASQFSVAGSGQSWAHPVVIGGRLYLRYDDNLYAFDVRGPDYAATADEKSGVKSTDDSAAKATPPPSPARPRPAAPAKPVDDEERTRRLWNMAENFLRNNLQALARSKLEEIVNKYPDTEHAEMARERLRNLR